MHPIFPEKISSQVVFLERKSSTALHFAFYLNILKDSISVNYMWTWDCISYLNGDELVMFIKVSKCEKNHILELFYQCSKQIHIPTYQSYYKFVR